jgi:hypothetical protein
MARVDFPEMLILVLLAAAGLAVAGASVVYNWIHPDIHSPKQTAPKRRGG